MEQVEWKQVLSVGRMKNSGFGSAVCDHQRRIGAHSHRVGNGRSRWFLPDARINQGITAVNHRLRESAVFRAGADSTQRLKAARVSELTWCSMPSAS